MIRSKRRSWPILSRILGAAVCVPILFFASPQALPAQDAEALTPYEQRVGWFSRDKGYHLAISAAGAGGIYLAAREVGLGRWPSAALASVLMGTVGILREVYDGEDPNRLTRDRFSRKDMVWNGVGIVVGVSVSDVVRRIR